MKNLVGKPAGFDDGMWQSMYRSRKRLTKKQNRMYALIFASVEPADGVSIRNTITDEILEDLYVHSGLYDRDN